MTVEKHVDGENLTVEVTVTDAAGAVRDESGRTAVEGGRGCVPLCLSNRDRATFPRGWRFQAKDLTTGLVSTP
mgnify:CR=1 FL=1